MAVGNHSAQLLLQAIAMSEHYICTNDDMLGHLGNTHRNIRLLFQALLVAIHT